MRNAVHKKIIPTLTMMITYSLAAQADLAKRKFISPVKTTTPSSNENFPKSVLA